MSATSGSHTKDERQRLLQLEDEVTFLRERNYYIQKLSDRYREKVSHFISSIYTRSKPNTGMTEAELEELIGRLRSQDVSPKRSSLSSPFPPTALPPSLSREDEDGLMHSTSSLSHATNEEPKPQTPNPPKPRETPEAGKPAAGEHAQRAAAARLIAENRRLASLIDALKGRLATSTRMNAALEKRLRASEESGRGADRSLSLSQLRRRVAELQEELERLRAREEAARRAALDTAHFKALVERQAAELEAVRRREGSAREDLRARCDKLAKVEESNRALAASLRLSRVRERRAVNAMAQQEQQQQEQRQKEQERTQRQQEMGRREDEERRSFFKGFPAEVDSPGSGESLHCATASRLYPLPVAAPHRGGALTIGVQTECDTIKEEVKVVPSFLDGVEACASGWLREHELLREQLIVSHIASMTCASLGMESEVSSEAVADVVWQLADATRRIPHAQRAAPLLKHIEHMEKDEKREDQLDGTAKREYEEEEEEEEEGEEEVGDAGYEEEEYEEEVDNVAAANISLSSSHSSHLIPHNPQSDAHDEYEDELDWEEEGEEELHATTEEPSTWTQTSPQTTRATAHLSTLLVDASTMTLSPVQISLGVGRSAPTSPFYVDRAVATTTPPMISLGTTTSPVSPRDTTNGLVFPASGVSVSYVLPSVQRRRSRAQTVVGPASFVQ